MSKGKLQRDQELRHGSETQTHQEESSWNFDETFADSCDCFFSAGDFSDFASKPRTFISFGEAGVPGAAAITGFSAAFAVVSGALDSLPVFPFT